MIGRSPNEDFFNEAKNHHPGVLRRSGGSLPQPLAQCPRHTTRKHTSGDDDSPARGMYDPTSSYSTLPGGINDASRYNHKWD